MKLRLKSQADMYNSVNTIVALFENAVSGKTRPLRTHRHSSEHIIFF